MLSGYNTNVPHKGHTYHVQTEDGGRGNPVITTLLYESGAILDSVQSTYADVLIDADWKTKVVALMREQHKKTIQAVMSCQYDEPEEQAQCELPEDDIESIVASYIV